MTRDEAIRRARAARVGRMATLTSERRPHVVPFVFAFVEDDAGIRAYWAVDDKPKRTAVLKRIRNLERDPAVEFVVDGYEEDWDRLWWVRCSGTGRVVRSAPERDAALAALRAKYPQHAAAPPSGPVVAIDIDDISGWQATRGDDR